MKKIFALFVLSVSLLACSKVETKEDDTSIKVSVIAELTSVSETKTIYNTMKIQWSPHEIVYMYDAHNYLGYLEVDKVISKTEGNMNSAVLKGNILRTPEAGTKTITMIYTNRTNTPPSVVLESGKGVLYFDLTNQDGDKKVDIPYVCQGKLPYNGQVKGDEIHEQVLFGLWTTTLHVTCGVLASGIDMSKVEIGNINTILSLTLKSDGDPTADGHKLGIIKKSLETRTAEDGFFKVEKNGTTRMYFSVPPTPDNGSDRLIYIQQGNNSFIGTLDGEGGKRKIVANDLCYFSAVLQPGQWGGLESFEWEDYSKPDGNSTEKYNYVEW